MSGEIRIHSERIKKHADELKNEVAPKIEAARTTLDGINLEGGDLSITGTAAAMAYPGALQFAFETLQTHEDQVKGFASTLETSAKNWKSGEEHSTVKQI
jgi:hypothetical protein